MTDRIVLATNLSYVLHEPSVSNTAQRMADIALAYSSQPRSKRAICCMITPAIDRSILQTAQYIAVHLGPTGSLIRTLSEISSAPINRSRLQFLDDLPINRSLQRIPLFGATAFLTTPMPESKRPLILAAMRSRPECAQTELFLTPIGTTDNMDLSILEETLTRLLRETPEQWISPRALWNLPAEYTLPELGGIRQSVS